MNQTDTNIENTVTGDPGRFRRLQDDELVSRGDLVENEQRRLVPWDGPSGFRASSFVSPVYRVNETPSTGVAATKS